MRSPGAPFPLWVHARDITDGLDAYVSSQLSRATVREIGCAMVLDGLDELAPAAAVRLLESAEEFCGAWPKSSANTPACAQMFGSCHLQAECPSI
jgi:hypothetical protein